MQKKETSNKNMEKLKFKAKTYDGKLVYWTISKDIHMPPVIEYTDKNGNASCPDFGEVDDSTIIKYE